MNIRKIMRYLSEISIIKTIRFNFAYFGVGGIFRPGMIVSRSVKISKLKGKVIIKNKKTACVRLGFSGVSVFDEKYERSIWQNDGVIIFEGNARLNQGTRIANHGELSFGEKFIITAKSSIICNKKITFCDDVMLSWDVLVMDSDLHPVIGMDDGIQVNPDKEVYIGPHTWVGCRSVILKGARLKGDTVIAAGSVITGGCDDENVVIGSNSDILKRNVTWMS